MNTNPLQLVYVDQNDNLSDSKDTLKLVQEAIQAQDLAPLYDTVADWYSDSENDALFQILKEENPTIDIDLLFSEDYDEYCNLRECMYERDTSNPMRDLLSNTPEQVFQFRTECEANQELANIKSFLQIPDNIKEHDETLTEMIENADGGVLRIYFITKLDNFLPLTEEVEPTTITFSGSVSIGIVDQFNGSGYTVEVDHTFTLPFTYANLFIDSVGHNNWTDDISGSTHDWCSGTEFKLTFTDTCIAAPVEITEEM